VLFSSGGGDVNSGITLYNYLRALPCTVVTHNIGNIDSIATAVFLAGEKRYATPNSAFVFHGVTWGFPQGANLTYSQMQEILSRFDAAEQLFAGIIGERTSFEASAVRELFRQGQSKDPAFAKSKGVVHEVREVSIEPGAPMLTVPHEGA
jgi:ATP-dependent Clp protease protease subunit